MDRRSPSLRTAATRALCVVLLLASMAAGQRAEPGATPLGQPAAKASHWAYRKPVRPTPPTASRADWIRNPIDAFVLHRLDARGSQPTPVEEPARLLRRVYLDLIGLPPTIEELDAFLADDGPDAWERVVDRLLASPRFGEHWAQQWLDLARYADSNGFQADQLRDSWAYRDWVIDALNDGMPFDRFSLEQLAGDLLPDPTLAQRIATGFHRNVPCNVEAGVDPEANRVNQVVDRVNTTATVWLGTTMECAQCHDHKYDPFSQRDYFRLFAFFNSTPIEVENGAGVRFDFYGPKIELPLDREQRALREDLRTALAATRRQQQLDLADLDAEQERWERRIRERAHHDRSWHVLPPVRFSSTGDEDHRVLDDQSILISGRVPGTTRYVVDVETDLAGITALRLETLTHPSLPGTGPGRGDVQRPNFILSEFTVTAAPRGSDEPSPVTLHTATADYSQPGWDVARAIDGKPDQGWAIGGGFFRDHCAIFRTASRVGGDSTRLTFTLDQNFGRGRTIGRFRLSAYTGDPELLAVPDDILAILEQSTPRSPTQRERVREHFRRNHPATERHARRIADLESRLAAIRPATALVMVEDEPRATHLMRRGNYLQPGERVTAGTPAALHPFRDAWPRNRLGLARWLTSPDNPLLARVTVNRWWSSIFGRGLVATEEDFGLRSLAPSHPALLDWLAVEFVDSGWSMKHVLRLIVTSATYRQSSRRPPPGPQHDADNQWLGRGPRFRMSAQMIRDCALQIGGLLSPKAGGPPVYPPQPPRLWRQVGRNEPKYVIDTDDDRFRRGVYVIWRRAAPYPSFVLFDSPDRASCHPRRSRTNTPMQALTLMNDAAFVEAALGLARRIQGFADLSTAQKVERAFRIAVARRPNHAEQRHLLGIFARERQRLAADPERARSILAGIHDHRREPHGARDPLRADAVETAAWFFVATTLLNLDETISKG